MRPGTVGWQLCFALIACGSNAQAAVGIDPAEVSKIAARSACKNGPWTVGDTSRAPHAYLTGMGLMYLEAYCQIANEEDAASVEMSRPNGGKPHDVFGYFDRELAEKQILLDTSAARLKAAFTIAIAVGMNESSGNPTVGPFITTDPEQAEAGLFQLSHNTLSSPPTSVWLGRLYEHYRTTPNACLTSVFMDGLHDRRSDPIGSGPPKAFQLLMKACPALAVEYGIV